MTDIEREIQEIHLRNKRVEADKAWETSWTRRVFVAAITYLTASLFLWLIETPHSYINAFVPTGGYLLSTLSLPWVKRWWMKKR